MTARPNNAVHQLNDDTRSQARPVPRIAAGIDGVMYSKIIGRVGALAIALGVGVGFTIGMPGLAWAEDSESSSSPGPTSKQPDTKPSTDPTASVKTSSGIDTQANSADPSNDPEPEPEQSSDDDDAGDDDDDGPNVVAAEPSNDTPSEPATVEPPVVAEPTPTSTRPLPADTGQSAAPQPVPAEVEPPAKTPASPQTPAPHAVSPAQGESATPPPSDPLGGAKPVDDPARLPDDDTSGDAVTVKLHDPIDSPLLRSSGVEANTDGESASAQNISLDIAPNPDRELLAIPTAAVNIATAFVAAVLSPILAPSPATPAQPPLLLFALLDWVRREIQRTFSNNTPNAVANAYTTAAGLDLSGNVLTNDTDADADTLRASLVDGPDHGSLTLNRDGTFVYTAAENYSGTDTFTYKVKDAGFHLHGLLGFLEPDQGHSDTAQVTITIKPFNNMPVTMGDNYAVTAGQMLTVAGPGVLANDNDIDGDPLTAVKFSDPSHGSVTLNPDGSFTYISDADFTGSDQFEYYSDDGITSGNPAFVNITVTDEAPPVAGFDSIATPVDTSVTIDADALLHNDFDNEGDPLTAIVTQAPENGDLVDNGDGTYTYTPDDGFIGIDAFEYVAADATGESEPAVVSINVGIPANTSPESVSDYLTARSDAPRVITPVELVGNDTDADGDILTPYAVSDPSHGTLDLNVGGTYTYTPDPGFVGFDTFYYTAFDGYAHSTPTEVTIGVGGYPFDNTPPVAGNDSLGTDIDTQLTIDPDTLLVNDFDADGGPLSVVVTQHPDNGTLNTDALGNLVYTPDDGFSGTDSFFYSASQYTDNSLPAQVTIIVGGPANTAPDAAPDQLITGIGTPLTITTADLVSNDTDADGDDLTASVLLDPADGALVDNGDGTLTYTPDSGFVGFVSFVYSAFDGQADSIPTLVTIEVGGLGPNTPPIALDDYLSTPVNTPLTITPISILGNDVDPDGDSSQLGAILVTPPSHGAISQDGSAVYTPDSGFEGVDAFTYQVDDGRDVSNIATVHITVGSAISA